MRSPLISMVIFTFCLSLMALYSCSFNIDPFGCDADGDGPYDEFTGDELEWLDINGYWVFEDNYGNMDTIHFGSEVTKRIYFQVYCSEGYYDEVNLELDNSPLINSDNNFTFSMSSSTYPQITGLKNGNVYISSETFFGEVAVLRDNNKFRTYLLEKGIGLTSYEYDDGDSVYTSQLIYHQLH